MCKYYVISNVAYANFVGVIAAMDSYVFGSINCRDNTLSSVDDQLYW